MHSDGKLQEGDLAPDFTLMASDRSRVTLSALRGHRVVLFFYIKDMTMGCTTEAREFSKLLKKFYDTGVLVYGISSDSLANHKLFASAENITFPLLADDEKRVIEAYGAWVEKDTYGKLALDFDRATFVISPEGKIEKIYRNVVAAGHATCVLGDIASG